MQAKLDALERAKSEPIAIIGMGCRFPGGADNPEAFWQLLHDGVDAISEVPANRWDVDAYYDANPETPGKMYTRYGGFIEQLDEFDPQFFGITPRETVSLDPQQRLLLEVSWEALENAALPPDKLTASRKTGVFMGLSSSDYGQLLMKREKSEIDAYLITGNSHSTASGRLSYFLGLQGPCLAVDTSCSSSLVAVHLAMMSLRNGECDLALAGGVNQLIGPECTINFSKARMLAPDGRCKAFDASANGFVRSEGCGVIVLKRLSDAVRDEDNILALIRGSAVNQDGRTSGLTVPNGPSQQAVIRQALENAKVEPSQVTYIEAHGTGTSLGDPIEVGALAAVFGQREQPLMLGSVKTNIGHLEAAAGIASLIKVVLSLQHGEIPPHLHFNNPSPYMAWDELPVQIPTEVTAWPSAPPSALTPSPSPNSGRGEYRGGTISDDDKGGTRIAGVSSFAFSGTNGHVVLEQAPVASGHLSPNGLPSTSERPLHLLTLSAKSENALIELAERYEKHVARASDPFSVADVCFTANTGRSHFHHRLAIVTSDEADLREKLAAYHNGEEAKGIVSGRARRDRRPKIAFLFTGQGSQYVGMGQQLYDTQPIFRQTLDRCAEILQDYLEYPLLSVLYPDLEATEVAKAASPTDDPAIQNRKSSAQPPFGLRQNRKSKIENLKLVLTQEVSKILHQTAYTQPALFAIEYALFELWKSWGVTPNVVMGHSVGELVAACAAGAFTLEDGLKLMAERGRLMQAIQSGDMVAVFANEPQVGAVINKLPLYERQNVSIAALNGPKNTVISGEAKALHAIVTILEEQRIQYRPLTVSHAFHSRLMEPMLDAFEQIAEQVTWKPLRIPLVSNLTGEWLPSGHLLDATYWRQHCREAVRFASGMNTLFEKQIEIFLEIGPKPILSKMGQRMAPERKATWLASLNKGKEAWPVLLRSLSTLYVQGVEINWAGFDNAYTRRRLPLPTYPFQRKRYWMTADVALNGKEGQRDVRFPVGSNGDLSVNGNQSASSSATSQPRELEAIATEKAPGIATEKRVTPPSPVAPPASTTYQPASPTRLARMMSQQLAIMSQQSAIMSQQLQLLQNARLSTAQRPPPNPPQY